MAATSRAIPAGKGVEDMGATIERSLYIGILKTRFDIFDDVKLKLKNGQVIEGEIIDLDENTVVLEDTGRNDHQIFVDDIEDYIAD